MQEPELDPIAPPTIRAAAGLVALEGFGLLVTAVVLGVLAVVHSSTRWWAALSIVGFALLGALVLLLCARGLLGLRPSSRSPVVLLELIALPVGYSLGIQAGRLVIALPILAAALGVLVLLFTPTARQALDRVV
ncbi:MAG: hypothetical protein ACR2N4_09235 [Jatrophihabitans sp.]